jgi:diguanylate cyclase (GGDEF)-like protein
MLQNLKVTLPRGLKRLSFNAIVSFLLMITLCSLTIAVLIIDKGQIERLTMERRIAEKSVKITAVIPRLLYKTQVIAAIIIQNNGELTGFERIAATVVDDPAIQNILVAPSGVVTHIYPLEGNEAVLGVNFLAGSPGHSEAVTAKETGKLILGGPYPLRQGGHGLVGRLPVYLDGSGGEKNFWGLVSITLRYPLALEAVGLDVLEQQGFIYEIWRINPDNNEKQVIADNLDSQSSYKRYIEKHVNVLNADWYFRIGIPKEWYEYVENWAMIIIGLLISSLIALIVQNNHDLRTMRGELETVANYDALTGISNRRYFMDFAPLLLAKAKRALDGCYVIMFDIDFFKKVNDNYGHAAGDQVLKAVAQRIKSAMRPYDLFARYGGEEFIVLLADLDENHVLGIAEKYRQIVSDTPVDFDGKQLTVTASFGVASALAADDLEAAIRQADEALYKAKEGGRNRVCLSE